MSHQMAKEGQTESDKWKPGDIRRAKVHCVWNILCKCWTAPIFNHLLPDQKSSNEQFQAQLSNAPKKIKHDFLSCWSKDSSMKSPLVFPNSIWLYLKITAPRSVAPGNCFMLRWNYEVDLFQWYFFSPRVHFKNPPVMSLIILLFFLFLVNIFCFWDTLQGRGKAPYKDTYCSATAQLILKFFTCLLSLHIHQLGERGKGGIFNKSPKMVTLLLPLSDTKFTLPLLL